MFDHCLTTLHPFIIAVWRIETFRILLTEMKLLMKRQFSGPVIEDVTGQHSLTSYAVHAPPALMYQIH